MAQPSRSLSQTTGFVFSQETPRSTLQVEFIEFRRLIIDLPHIRHLGMTSSDELTTFGGLGLSPWLEQNLLNLGMEKPTRVQEECIPAILAGRDILAAAQTGSGKTAAFALPIIQRLQTNPYGVFAVCLTPSRELALQITEQFNVFCLGTSLKCRTVLGGEDMKSQAQTISTRPHIICATPGRLTEHFIFNDALTNCFKKVSFLVLDEADRLLDPCFDSEIRIILSRLPSRRQTLLFSATMTQSIAAMKEMGLRNVFHLDLKNSEPAENCRQRYCFVPRNMKEAYLAHILSYFLKHNLASIIVFSNSTKTCELLHRTHNYLGIRSTALHSLKRQKERHDSLEKFRSRRVPVLFATDVASRGIDITSVDVVINFDTPGSVPDYIHRIGRTARAECTGEAVTLVTQYDVERFLTIEKVIDRRMEHFEVNEKDVMSGLTRIMSATRTVRLQMAQDFDTKLAGRKRSRR